MDQHETDKRVREELKDLEANPPVEAWIAISGALDKHARRRYLPLFFRVAASVAALTAAVFSLWFLMPDEAAQDFALIERPDRPVMQPLTAMEAPVLDITAPSFLTRADMQPGQDALFADVRHEGLAYDPGFGPVRSMHSLPMAIPAWMDEGSWPSYERETRNEMLARAERSNHRQIGDLSPDDRSAGVPNIRLGAHFAPQSNYRLISEDAGTAFQNIPFESLEESILTYGMGLNASFRLSRRWSVQTGVNYQHLGQYVKDIMAYAHPANMPLYEKDRSSGRVIHPQTIITSQGNVRMHDPYHYFADMQSVRVVTSKQSFDDTGIKTLKKSAEGFTQLFRFVEVPLLFRYHIVNSGFGLQLKAGVSGNYLLQNDVFLGKNIWRNAIGDTHGIRQISFSAVSGLSLDVPITARLTLHMEPTAQIFLNPLLRESLMVGKVYPYSYSVQTGISYGF